MHPAPQPIHVWAYVLAYSYACLFPILPLFSIERLLWWHVTSRQGISREAADKNQDRLLPSIVGILERPLYVGTLLIGRGEFIGIWLALKVAGGWEAWSEGTKIEIEGAQAPKEIGGRSVFNTFFIATGISLLNAIAAANALELHLSGTFRQPWLPIASAALFTLAIWLWLCIKARAKPRTSSTLQQTSTAQQDSSREGTTA